MILYCSHLAPMARRRPGDSNVHPMKEVTASAASVYVLIKK